MTDEPIAVLFSYDPETGEHSCDPLVGRHPNGSDPISWARALKEDIEGDFSPSRIWTVGGNDAAHDMHRDDIMKSLERGGV